MRRFVPLAALAFSMLVQSCHFYGWEIYGTVIVTSRASGLATPETPIAAIVASEITRAGSGASGLLMVLCGGEGEVRLPFHHGAYGGISEGTIWAWLEPSTIKKCGPPPENYFDLPECAGTCGGRKPDVTIAENAITVWKDGKGPNPLTGVEITIE